MSKWESKQLETPDEVMQFLNGEGAYQDPVGDARITLVYSGSKMTFTVYYTLEPSDRRFGQWAWKRSPSREDVCNFLNSEASYRTAVTDAEACSGYMHSRGETFVFYTYAPTARNGIPDVGPWLGLHHNVRDSIVWEMADSQDGGRVPVFYRDWPTMKKRELQQAFELAWRVDHTDLPDIPPNMVELNDEDGVTTVINESLSWQLFLSHAAQSLVNEIDQRVPWHITEYSSEWLANLFDGRQFLRWDSDYGGYRVMAGGAGALGPITPAPADLIMRFITEHSLIGDNRLDTIGRLLGWARDHLVHYFSGDHPTRTMDDVWQYRGWPPVVRILNGTVDTRHPDHGKRYWINGCHGSSAFQRHILRVLNIPVQLIYPCHCSPHFMSEDHYLSHGDDPYNSLVKARPPFPAIKILIDQTTYEAWFGEHLTQEERCRSVGRRPKELAVQYLPDTLLRKHCEDLKEGLNHAESKVFETLQDAYTLEELEELQLWERMDAKIAERGGCDEFFIHRFFGKIF